MHSLDYQANARHFRLALTCEVTAELASTMAGRPYRSDLEPFFDLIIRWRRDDKLTWEEISVALTKEPEWKGKPKLTRQAVQDFYRRHRHKRKKYPMGMEPEETPQTAPADRPEPKHSRTIEEEFDRLSKEQAQPNKIKFI